MMKTAPAVLALAALFTCNIISADEAEPAPSVQLSASAQLHYNTVIMILDDLDREQNSPARAQLWRDILTRSEPLKTAAPDFMPAWIIRAQAALELNLWEEGHEAGRRLLGLGALDRGDSELSAILTRLNRRGWLEKNPAKIRLAELSRLPALKADISLPDALNTQILKIIKDLTGDHAWEGFSGLKTIYVTMGRDQLIGSALARRCIAAALGQACARDDLELAELAIVCGGDVNATVDGQTPVFWAAANGNADVVSLLIAADAEVNGRSKLGRSILAEPAGNGNADVVRILTEAGVDPNTPGKRRLPLVFEAVEDGHRDVVSVLVDAGCDMNITSGGEDPKPILLPAIQRNDIEMTKILLRGGANPDAEYKEADMFSCAKKLGYKELYYVLKKRPRK